MNTTAKGDAFELRVYNALKRELQDERLCASPKHSRIFQNKGYQSRDRGSDIDTDVSIEIFLPDCDLPALIWIFECKDYADSIPVNEVEEFHAKLKQIGEDNTKGTFVTSGALQRGALSFARSKGIGIIRLLPNDQIKNEMAFLITTTSSSIDHSLQIDWSEFEVAIVTPRHRSKRSFFAIQDGYRFDSWFSMLSNALLD